MRAGPKGSALFLSTGYPPESLVKDETARIQPPPSALGYGFAGMEAVMSFVREYPAPRRKRAPRMSPSIVVLGLSAWLVLGLLSQAAFS